MFNPGRLKDRIMIQNRSLAVTGGISAEVWQDDHEVWAEAEEIRGTRAMQMDGYTAVSRARFWVRDTASSAALRPEDARIEWNGKIWSIQSNVKLVIERNMREIFCEEWVGEA